MAIYLHKNPNRIGAAPNFGKSDDPPNIASRFALRMKSNYK